MNSPQKNILFLLHLPPPVHGSSIVGQTIKDNQLINNSFDCRYINLLISRVVSETGKTSFLKISRFISIWFKLLGALIHRRPDLCYFAISTTGSAFIKDCLLVVLLKIFKIKTIYHLHNKGIKHNETKSVYNFLYKFAFKNANVILLSEHLYFDIEKYVSPWKVYYCPNGINDYELGEASKPTIYESGKFKILFLSNLIESKGVYLLIDACALLKEKGCEFQCDFIGGEGDVSEKQFNEYVRQKNLADKVKYLGKKFGRLKEEAFEIADVFVLPTFYPNECFPVVIIEAMQHSTPVISTFEGGIPDMIDEGITGFLIPQKNVEALAEKLELLLRNHTLREQMGKKARVKYENNYTLKIFERKLLSIFQDAIK